MLGVWDKNRKEAALGVLSADVCGLVSVRRLSVSKPPKNGGRETTRLAARRHSSCRTAGSENRARIKEEANRRVASV